MVVMGDCNILNGAGLLPESFSYIYISMCNRHGTCRELVEEQGFRIKSGVTRKA